MKDRPIGRWAIRAAWAENGAVADSDELVEIPYWMARRVEKVPQREKPSQKTLSDRLRDAAAARGDVIDLTDDDDGDVLDLTE